MVILFPAVHVAGHNTNYLDKVQQHFIKTYYISSQK
jgi:hypothetical protein